MRYLTLFISVTALGLSACAAGQDGLEALHADIVSDYPTVAHIDAENLPKLEQTNTLILDIREPEEYAVSRLPGAIWVSPDSDAETAIIQVGDVRGKDILVYCSVGRRSSLFAQRVQEAWREQGARSVTNLENGIFGWHNESRALVDAEGATDAVHPYDAYWGRYVTRQDGLSYSPK